MLPKLFAWLAGHPLLTFLLMGGCFLGFGLTTLNLALFLKLNLDLFIEHGWVVIWDGALQQLIELLSLGYFAMVCWLGFKSCETLLVDRLTGKESTHKESNNDYRDQP
jgi:hypothetical protein